MSDTSQGPGWWLASDGRWYPPEAWTGPPGPPGSVAYPTYGSGPGLPTPTLPGRPPVAGQTNGLAVASLVCSCVGLIPFLFGLPCILGIVFGFVARSQIRRSSGGQEGGGLALAGIIVGFSLIALFMLGLIIIVIVAHNQNCSNNFGTYRCSLN